MSWYIKCNKKIFLLLLLLGGSLGFIGYVYNDILPIIICLWGFILFALYVNIIVRKKIFQNRVYFEAKSNLRNIDCLIIGSMCNEKNLINSPKKVLKILSPSKSLEASYELLRHLYSIVRADGLGEVIIVWNNDNHKTGFSIFDIPFLHLVTINRLQLKHLVWQSKFPLVFAPVSTFRYLICRTASSYCDVVLSIPELTKILDFCIERNLQVRIVRPSR